MFEPTSENFWRGIVLYGRNQSTYKMGLADRLLYYANKNTSKIPLYEFGDNWLDSYTERIKDGDTVEFELEEDQKGNRLLI